MAEEIDERIELTPEAIAPDKPLNWLGKTMVLVTVLVTLGAAFPITSWTTGQLGWGIYPIVMLIIPVLAVGFGFWVAIFKLCEYLGIPLERDV